jgi:hypothetical protein
MAFETGESKLLLWESPRSFCSGALHFLSAIFLCVMCLHTGVVVILFKHAGPALSFGKMGIGKLFGGEKVFKKCDIIGLNVSFFGNTVGNLSLGKIVK